MKDYVSWRTSDNKNTAQDMCVAFLKLNADTVYTGECLTLITKLVAAAQAA
jgi:hypothetical protein